MLGTQGVKEALVWDFFGVPKQNERLQAYLFLAAKEGPLEGF